MPPSSSSVAAEPPNPAVVLAMKAPLATSSVPLEVMLAITRLPPVGARPDNGALYGRCKNTVPPAGGEKAAAPPAVPLTTTTPPVPGI